MHRYRAVACLKLTVVDRDFGVQLRLIFSHADVRRWTQRQLDLCFLIAFQCADNFRRNSIFPIRVDIDKHTDVNEIAGADVLQRRCHVDLFAYLDGLEGVWHEHLDFWHTLWNQFKPLDTPLYARNPIRG